MHVALVHILTCITVLQEDPILQKLRSPAHSYLEQEGTYQTYEQNLGNQRQLRIYSLATNFFYYRFFIARKK